MKKRTGSIYEEYTNPGNVHAAGRFVRGVGLVSYKHRFVAEITVLGKRYRFRSTNIDNCRAWLNDMVEKYKDD